MSKKKFRIGELAKELQVKKFVIRFWEKEFALTSDRSQGGQRYYTEKDFRAFHTIKDLLYQQGYTISGAKTKLQDVLTQKKNSLEEFIEPTQIKAATKVIENSIAYVPEAFLEKVGTLKRKLIKLQQTLG